MPKPKTEKTEPIPAKVRYVAKKTGKKASTVARAGRPRVKEMMLTPLGQLEKWEAQLAKKLGMSPQRAGIRTWILQDGSIIGNDWTE